MTVVDQILIVKFKDGKTKRYKRTNWSDLFDLRDKLEAKPGVVETRLEYDIKKSRRMKNG